jgi:hypothetical protein
MNIQHAAVVAHVQMNHHTQTRHAEKLGNYGDLRYDEFLGKIYGRQNMRVLKRGLYFTVAHLRLDDHHPSCSVRWLRYLTTSFSIHDHFAAVCLQSQES